MADTTGRIPLWLIGTLTGILVIGLIGLFFPNEKNKRILIILFFSIKKIIGK